LSPELLTEWINTPSKVLEMKFSNLFGQREIKIKNEFENFLNKTVGGAYRVGSQFTKEEFKLNKVSPFLFFWLSRNLPKRNLTK